MESVSADIAENEFPQLLARVEAGEEIVVTRGDKPVARLVPAEPPAAEKPKREFGSMRGQFTVPPEFFDPLSEEELALWE